ncbi:hypothetical protein WJX84_001488 [Apatococcus fuscideae]|uniref:Uncharacterized protein n=1 Tax=Apatococcus fuscideae TaxID=2026836 RepID=A0AAW1SJC5_9CHLO
MDRWDSAKDTRIPQITKCRVDHLCTGQTLLYHMRVGIFLTLLTTGQALKSCGNIESCRRELLQQTNLDLHGGFGDATRHEQYDFHQSEYYQKIRSNTSSYTLPERPQSPAECTPELLHTGLLEAGGSFYSSPDGHYYFEPAMCRLRRLSGKEARQCLSGRHIDFIGDSVTRYQYMSLVDFLSQMRYQAPYGANPQSPSMSMYWEWGDWAKFYQGSQDKLAQAVEATVKETSEPAPELIRVSYEQIYDLPTFHQAGLHGLIQALRHRQLTTGPPSAVIMNQGLWAYGSGDLDHTSDPYRTAALQSTIDMGATLAETLNRTKLLWKTTTVAADDLEPLYAAINANTVEAAMKSKAWTLYDVRSITEAAAHQGLDFMTDNLHFIPLMYEQFNDLLLNMVCNLDNTWYGAKAASFQLA